MPDHKLQLFNTTEGHQRLLDVAWSRAKELERIVLHSDWTEYTAEGTEGELMHSENEEAPWIFNYQVG